MSAPSRPNPTILDVAAHAGVSVKTVSRILNNAPNISSRMIARVTASMEALSFTPNQNARNLAGATDFVIATPVINYGFQYSGYFATVQAASSQVCEENHFGYMMQRHIGPSADLTPAKLLEVLRHRRVAGALLLPPIADMEGLPALLERNGIACAAVSPKTPGSCRISAFLDEREAAREMTIYLLDQGHERIGFIGGPDAHGAARARYEGYTDALEARGIAVDPTLIDQGTFIAPSGREAAARLLSQSPRPTAIMACNDEMAAGVLQQALSLGLQIPADLSVTGFDDGPVVEFVWPRLTTVHQPIADMTMAAVRALIDTIRTPPPPGEPPVSIQFSHKLMIRGSTGPAPTARFQT
jgi:LacI family transcriptional regulator